MTFGFLEAEKASLPISRMCCVPEVNQSPHAPRSRR